MLIDLTPTLVAGWILREQGFPGAFESHFPYSTYHALRDQRAMGKRGMRKRKGREV